MLFQSTSSPPCLCGSFNSLIKFVTAEVIIIKTLRHSRLAILTVLIVIVLTIALVFKLTNSGTQSGSLFSSGELSINPSKVTVRKGPGLDYSKVKVTKTFQSQILQKRNGWLKVRLANNKTAWVPSWQVENTVAKTAATKLSNATIVIDAGHGGNDSGALYDESETSSYYMEKNYTLKLAKLVAKELRARGARIILTRDNDRYVDLKSRPETAESIHADAFISFHFDSSPYANEGTGVTTYYYHKGNNSKKLASAINSQFNNLPLRNNGVDFSDFLVLRDNTRPAILCEMGYINTDQDFKQITSSTYRTKVAKDIVNGLDKYFKEVN